MPVSWAKLYLLEICLLYKVFHLTLRENQEIVIIALCDLKLPELEKEYSGNHPALNSSSWIKAREVKVSDLSGFSWEAPYIPYSWLLLGRFDIEDTAWLSLPPNQTLTYSEYNHLLVAIFVNNLTVVNASAVRSIQDINELKDFTSWNELTSLKFLKKGVHTSGSWKPS